MEPGIYDRKGNLIKSWGDLTKEGINLERFCSYPEIKNEPSSACNLFEKYNPVKLVLPKSINSIGDCALAFCESLEEIVLPPLLDALGNETFSGCSRLKEIFIPSTLTFCCKNTFYNCISLERIDVDPKNALLSSEDGVLFSKDEKELIFYPINKKDKTYKIPNKVKRIDEEAFLGNEHIEEIIFPEGIEIIGLRSFQHTNLVKVYIPNSVKGIGYHAFAGCDNLETVRLPDDVEINLGAFTNCKNLEEINVTKTFVETHKGFVEKFKDKIKVDKTLDELLDEGVSFKEINKKFKDKNVER